MPVYLDQRKQCGEAFMNYDEPTANKKFCSDVCEKAWNSDLPTVRFIALHPEYKGKKSK